MMLDLLSEGRLKESSSITFTQLTVTEFVKYHNDVGCLISENGHSSLHISLIITDISKIL